MIFQPMNLKTQKGILIFSIALFVASLFSPTIEEFNLLDSHPDVMPGYLVLAWGWYAITFLHPAWFANITWITGNILFLKEKYRACFYLSILTSLLTLDSYVYPSEKYTGFYLWNVAMNLPLATGLIARAANRLNPTPSAKQIPL